MLDQIFRKYFFVIVLLAIAAFSWLLAFMAGTFVEGLVSVQPKILPGTFAKKSHAAEASTPKAEDPKNFPFDHTHDEKAKAEADKADEEEQPAAPGTVDWSRPPKPSDLPAKVVSILRHSDPEWSLVTMQYKGDTHLYRRGSLLEGQTIVAIADTKVYFVNKATVEYLSFNDKPASASSGYSRDDGDGPSPPPMSSPPSESGDGDSKIHDGVKKVSESEWELERSMLNEQLSDLNKLGTQARIIPNYKDGKYSGFKLIGIRPNSLYAAIGIRSGDVIKMINGEEITSPNQALALYDKLKTADVINLEVERRGANVTQVYKVK